jgi:hypothetical protein
VTSVSDPGPRLSRHGPAGRAEFRRVLLDSLIASAVTDLELRRSQRQRLRTRTAQRRLDELTRERRELDADRFTPRSWGWARSAATGYLVTLVWLLGAALLGVQIALHGVHTWPTIAGDIAMLALSLLWFLLAVARVPVRSPEGDEPEAPASAAPRG